MNDPNTTTEETVMSIERAARLDGIRHGLSLGYRPLGNYGWRMDTVRFLVEEIDRLADEKAAARREALGEVRQSAAFIRTPPDNCVGLSRAQAFHVGVGEVVTLLDNALAEPEHDEEK